MFENRVLRVFGPKSDEVTGEWRKTGAQNIVKEIKQYQKKMATTRTEDEHK